MIIVMRHGATPEEIAGVVAKIDAAGLKAHVSQGAELTVIGAVGEERDLRPEMFERLPGVERAMHVVKPYKIVARDWQPKNSVIDVKGVPIGGPKLQVIAGPCSVETPEQMARAARAVRAADSCVAVLGRGL